MILDNLTKISELDTENMFQMVYDWAELIEEILQHSFVLPVKTEVGRYLISYQGPISQILICGMGGSAISGEYLSAYLNKYLKIPVIVNRNYDIPAFTSENTLVILISYSGNTEETISCLITAVKKSAKIIGIGSGGTLEEFCKKYNLPFFPIPSGYQPRASFPLLFFPLLKILHSLKLLPLDQSAIDETLSIFRQMRQDFDSKIPTVSNKAKQIAQKLYDRIPVIWSP
ncbi:MAG: SIS domain-containing protein, partial [Candidatus Hodarchaeota archaeon]